MLTLEEYIAGLKAKDWAYEMSDDHSVWQKGFNEHSRLALAQTKHDPEYLLWNAFAPEGHKIGRVFTHIEVKPEFDAKFNQLQQELRNLAVASLGPEWEFVQVGALRISIAGAVLVPANPVRE